MNDIDRGLLDRLSALRAPGLPADLDANLEARLLERLRRHHPRSAVVRFALATLARRWEPFFFVALAVLLGWDLLRVIGYLLG
jgi:hypothetical protein